MDQSAQDEAIATGTATLAAKLAELEKKIDSLIDRQQIVDVYRSYTRGLNRHDMELLRDTFWPDAQINYGPASRLRDEWIRFWEETRHLKGLACQAHHITNESIDIAGDVAHVESYLIAFWKPPKDGESSLIIGGRYIDRVDRRNGEWRIFVREFIPHFLSTANSAFNSCYSEAEWFSTNPTADTDHRKDPCYQRPLVPRASSDSDHA